MATSDAFDAETRNEPFVSVVIPSYNSMGTIKDCLVSVQSQSYPRDRYEILVADNGSRDNTLPYLRKHFPEVKTLEVSSVGAAYARNAGFAAAKGSLILSTDSDCVVDRNWIRSLLKAYGQAAPGTAAIGGLIKPFALNNLIERYRKTWVSQPVADNPDARIRYTATPNALFDAHIFQQMGGFDPSAGHFDDADLGIRLTKAGFHVEFTDEAIVWHRNPAAWKELYRHRRKYGVGNYRLAQAHPDLLGSPVAEDKLKSLRRESLRRILGDVVKLPWSLVKSGAGRPRGWPLVDAVIAWSNYRGFAQAGEPFRSKRSAT